MNESKIRIKKILDELCISNEIPKFKKVRILDCESVVNDGFGSLIGKEFFIKYSCKNEVCIEYNKTDIWFKYDEYEFVKEE